MIDDQAGKEGEDADSFYFYTTKSIYASSWWIWTSMRLWILQEGYKAPEFLLSAEHLSC
jgi:hypothetical protein